MTSIRERSEHKMAEPVSSDWPNPPTATGYFRFLNMWVHAQGQGLTGPNKKVLILGPGKCTDAAGVDHCPQVAEASRIWNHSTLFVLDCNQEVLDAVKSIDQDVSKANITATWFDENNKTFGTIDSGDYQKICKLLLSGSAVNCDIVTIQFNMGLHKLPENISNCDVIVATFSLVYPMQHLGQSQDLSDQRIGLLGEFIQALKPGGVMYVERGCIIALLRKKQEDRRSINLSGFPERGKDLAKKIQEIYSIQVEFTLLPQIFGMPTIGPVQGVKQPFQKDLKSCLFLTATDEVYAMRRAAARV
ncbi:MAG: hypothetical protein WCF19_03815 [Chlamydiales bacterium]